MALAGCVVPRGGGVSGSRRVLPLIPWVSEPRRALFVGETLRYFVPSGQQHRQRDRKPQPHLTARFTRGVTKQDGIALWAGGGSCPLETMSR